MKLSGTISARRMVENDLDGVLNWRNHPDVRKFMLTQHEITPSEHWSWFNQASRDETRALLVVEESNIKLGCVIFSGVNNNSTADWSFYVAPGSPAGTGKRVCKTALNYAFTELPIYKVSGQVIDFNQASIHVHRSLGFTQEGQLRHHILINGVHCDLLHFGILLKEWALVSKISINF